MTGWIAIDGGQSAVRVQTSSSDRVFVGGGFNHATTRVDELTDAVTAAVRDVLNDLDQIDVVAMGHTGLPVDDAERQQIARALATLFGASEIRLAPDMVTAHAGALDGAAGVVIAAGTGTVCLGIDAEGTIARVDGWGYLFGDAGSSFSIGRKGLEVAMRHLDGRLDAEAVFDAALSYFGSDLRAATWDLYASASAVDTVARFAPSVLEAALTGDHTAASIVDDAVAELVATTSAACSALHHPEPLVSYAGGLFSAGDRVILPFTHGLAARAPGVRVVPPLGDPLAGSVRLARHDPGIHSPLVHIYREFS